MVHPRSVSSCGTLTEAGATGRIALQLTGTHISSITELGPGPVSQAIPLGDALGDALLDRHLPLIIATVLVGS